MGRKSPLHEITAADGAVFRDFFSWEVPEHFSDPLGEYTAVRNDAGVLDLSSTGKLRIGGRDRVRYLHRMLSNDIKNLHNGAGCYATMLTHQGRMETDLFAYSFANELWLECPPAGLEQAKATLTKYVVSDVVTIEDWTENLAILSLQGPGARAKMAHHLGISLDALPVLGHISLGDDRTPRFVVRRDRSGCDGYDLWIPQGEAPAVWQEWGLDETIRPVGLRALDWLRTEAGIPWYGVDMDERNLPMELGLDAAVSTRKGCYRGQEIVARVLHRGHLDRRLSGLIVNCENPPDPGAEVRSAGVKIGTVTSAVFSPRLGKPLALAIVKSSVLQSGMPIQVIYGREAYPADIVRLPLV